MYLDPKSPTFIKGINYTFADQNQIIARADAGGEGGVVQNSALALLQGLFPANETHTTTLANGTTITGPLGGYQVICFIVCCQGYVSLTSVTTSLVRSAYVALVIILGEPGILPEAVYPS